jgi:uncharacterized protein YggU (UPF0235/DUF167 family)
MAERYDKSPGVVNPIKIPRIAENNKRLVEILSEYFKVSKSSVVISRGLKSRNKIIEIK